MRTTFRMIALPLFVGAGLLCAQGCASTRSSSHSVDDEARMLQEQAKKIIAQTRDLGLKHSERIRVNDSITIQVWKRDKKTQFSGFPVEAAVPGSGKVFVPHMGPMSVLGKTDAEVRSELLTFFGRILKNAIVVVEHEQEELPGSQRDSVMLMRHITIMGWVTRPGIYPVEPGITVRDMIAHAGGAKQFAKLRKVYVVRGSVENPEVLTVNMKKILTGKDMAQNIALEPNDGIYVPPVGMWKVYNAIRVLLLPITAVRDAVWVSNSLD